TGRHNSNAICALAILIELAIWRSNYIKIHAPSQFISKNLSPAKTGKCPELLRFAETDNVTKASATSGSANRRSA
ncbi:MAG TPA: hypothetical protein VIK28_06745, partial [Sedimentisphaerales bacterium]